jgi:hypothetical protein
MAERLKTPAVVNEVTRLIKAHPSVVLDSPEALKYLLGDKLDRSLQGKLKVIIVKLLVDVMSWFIFSELACPSLGSCATGSRDYILPAGLQQ